MESAAAAAYSLLDKVIGLAFVLVGLAPVVLALGGCGALDFLIDQTRTVTVQLVNDSDFSVRVRMFYSDEQNIPESLLTSVGGERNYDLSPGERQTETFDCNDFQAVIIDDADLQVIGAVGPEANTDVLRDGDDFDCRDQITFTFDHSSAIVDFDIEISVAPRN